MIGGLLLSLCLGLHAALGVQAMGSRRGAGAGAGPAGGRGMVFRPQDDAEAEALIRQIEASLRAALPEAEITSSLTPEDLRNMAPPPSLSELEGELDETLSSEDWERAGEASRIGLEPNRAGRARREVERMEDDAEEAGEAAMPDGGQDGDPPASGLRRWVIRIRNFMFGRRDLEGAEGGDGEAEGDPESGRTWAESLAHWFAHGIKRILIRISGSDEAEGGEGGEAAPAPGPAPDDAQPPTVVQNIPRRPATGGRPPPPASAPAPKPAATKPWTTTAPAPAPTATPAPEASAKPDASTPSATVYDDEAFDEGPGINKVHMPVDETNELN